MEKSKNTIIMSSLKIVLMSTGLLTIAILLSYTTPNLVAFATSHIPHLFATLRSWLRPPYLYFLINAIIVAIVFLHNNNHHHAPPQKAAYVAASAAAPSQPHHHENGVHDVISLHGHDHFSASYDVVSATVAYTNNVTVEDERETIKRVVFVNENDDPHHREMKPTVEDKSTWSAPPSSTPPLMRQGCLKKEGLSTERPPASARFANHRRPTKPTPAEGGKSLKVSKPKKHDTLESTWKTITEGRHVPLNRHLKKSDTWENNVRQIDVLEDPCPFPTKVKKSETFKERTSHTTTPPVTSTNKLKKEPSLGQDELNRRVEAFINKFNEDMRLQRQESMQQFMEMINRAA